jgi:hypothetical protein
MTYIPLPSLPRVIWYTSTEDTTPHDEATYAIGGNCRSVFGLDVGVAAGIWKAKGKGDHLNRSRGYGEALTVLDEPGQSTERCRKYWKRKRKHQP